MNLFHAIELPSETPVAYVGVYVLKWDDTSEPTIGFYEAEDTQEELETLRRQRDELSQWLNASERYGLALLTGIHEAISLLGNDEQRLQANGKAALKKPRTIARARSGQAGQAGEGQEG